MNYNFKFWIFLIFLSMSTVKAQDVSITINPGDVKHDADSYIVGANRNNVEDFVIAFDNTYGPGAYDAMVNQYGDINPRFGKQKKLYRLGGSNVDGLASGEYGGGYHFQQEFGNTGPYANDDINYFIDEADQLNSDMIIGVNVGSGTPTEAAALVQYFKDEGLLDKVAYFEMGNELMGSWQKGYNSGVSCFAQMYADYVVPFIDAMKNVDSSIKIAVCGSYVNGWEWPNCNDSSDQENIEDFFPIFFETIGDRMDYIAYHAYMPYEVISPKVCTAGDDNDKGRLIMAVSDWSINNRLNLAHTLIDDLKSQYGITKEIKLVNSEFGMAIETSSALENSITEALYTADHMLTALQLDIRSCINFCLYHWDYGGEDFTDNIFFSPDGQSLKPTFYVHQLVAENFGNTVVGHNLDQNTNQVNVTTCGSGTPYSYDKLGIVSSKDANGDIRTLIVNRSEQDITLSVDIAGGGSYANSEIKTVAGSSFTDQTTSIVSTSVNNLSSITIPKLSANVLISNTTGNCAGSGNTETGCDVTVGINGLNVDFVSTTLGGPVIVSIYEVTSSGWVYVDELCNGYTNGCDANTQAVVLPNAGTYAVLTNNAGCSFNIIVDGSPGGGGGVDNDGDGVCSVDDCDDNNASIGAIQSPGTACNDNNSSTSNDQIQADGCTCLGTPSCTTGPVVTETGCDVTVGIDGLNVDFVSTTLGGPVIVSIYEVTSSGWVYVDELCNGYTNGCDANTQAVVLPNAGTYAVLTNNAGCSFNIIVDGSSGGGGGVDNDGDGVCSVDDCDDNNASIGAIQAPGTSCNDNNSSTSNDQIQADGCTCSGTPGGNCTTYTDCAGDATIEVCGNTVKASNISSNVNSIKIQNPNTWQIVEVLCVSWNDSNYQSCSGSPSVTVGNGNYNIKVERNGGLPECLIPNVLIPNSSPRLNNVVAVTDDFMIVPNPAQNVANLILGESWKEEELEIRILGVSGQLVKRVVKDYEGLNSIQVDLTEMDSGVYFVSITSFVSMKKEVAKLVVTK